jgi:hypothetical protein
MRLMGGWSEGRKGKTESSFFDKHVCVVYLFVCAEG